MVEGTEKMTIPIHELKMKVLRDHALEYGLEVLVETGTFEGDAVDSLLDDFKTIYSIELNPILYERAKERFKDNKHVHLLFGDSTVVLPVLLNSVKVPTLFWLDAHYSGGETALGETITPVVFELAAIFEKVHPRSVVLIDDARLFVTDKGYPELDRVMDGLRTFMPDHFTVIANDMIRCCPSLSQPQVPF